MSTKSALTALAALVLCAAPAAAQDDGPPMPQLPALSLTPQSSDAEVSSGLDAWITDLAREQRFNGAVLVARDGREIYAGAHGVRDVASNQALTVDTRFPLASIGKAFTHVAIAQLIEAGRLSPDDTIGELLPDYPTAASRGATVQQLLTHRGGIADIFGPVFRDTPKDRLASNHAYYELVASQPSLFAPGAQEEYCNGCYVVLGEIVARVSGRSYEDYVAENVFARAGMARSGFLSQANLPDDAARFTGRPQGPQGPLMDVSRFHGFAGSAAGNAYSTVRDMLAFDTALREHRLVNPALTAEILRGQPETGRATARIGFAGGAPGVNTMLYGNGAVTFIVLTNREPPTAEAIGQTVFPLLAGPRPQ